MSYGEDMLRDLQLTPCPDPYSGFGSRGLLRYSPGWAYIIAHISIRLNMHAQRGEEGIGRHHSGSKWMLRYA